MNPEETEIVQGIENNFKKTYLESSGRFLGGFSFIDKEKKVIRKQKTMKMFLEIKTGIFKLKKCKEVEEIPANGRSQNVKPDQQHQYYWETF